MNAPLPDDPRSVCANVAKRLRARPELWIQGSHWSFGRMCLIGHVSDFTGPQSLSPLYRATRQAIRDALGLMAPGQIADWNDAPGRTVAEVIELCEKVANG